MAPTLAGTALAANTTSGTAMTTASFTPATGETLVLVGVGEDVTGFALGTPTNTGSTLSAWTRRALVNSASRTYTVLWTATVTAGGTATTVTLPKASGPAQQAAMVLTRWTNAKLAATPAVVQTVGSGAPSASLTTAAGSVVVWGIGDWNAVVATPAYRSSAVQDLIVQSSGVYCAYGAHQTAATAGAQTLGMTAPTGQAWAMVGVELQDAGGGGTGPGSVTAASPSVTLAAKAPAVSAEAVVTGGGAAAVTVALRAPAVAGTAVPNQGSGSGTLGWASSGTGKKLPKGSASGAYALSSGGTGKKVPKASAGGTLAWSSAASGAAPAVGAKSGSGSGAWSLSSAGSGRRDPRGAGSGALSWGAAGSGSAPLVPPSSGGGAGGYSWAATAAGTAPSVGVPQGWAEDFWGFNSYGEGQRPSRGEGTGSFAWSGTAAASPPKFGAGSGGLAWSSSAAGMQGLVAMADLTVRVGRPEVPTFKAQVLTRWEASVASNNPA